MPEPGKEEEGKGSRIVFKLDGSMITALAALLGALGFGAYNTATDPNDDIHTIGAGVVETSEASAELEKKMRKLVTLVKRKNAEIDELYETTDWLIEAIEVYGVRHRKDFRDLRRDAPAHIDFNSADESYRGEESVTSTPEEIEPDELFTEIIDEDETPKAMALPAIKKVLQRRKK